MILRDYQREAVDGTINYLRGTQGNGLIAAATGTGKSIIIASLCERLIKANPAIKIVVATFVAELVEQDYKKFHVLCPDIKAGVYSAGLGRKEFHETIMFVGIQSIYKIDIGRVNLLIIDEAHALPKKKGGIWHKFIDGLKAQNPRLRIIGLSASPFRLDSGNLTTGDDAVFDDIIFDYGLKCGIDDGWLVRLQSKNTKTEYDISKVGKIAGEYNLKELEAATNIDEKTRQAVTETINFGQDKRSFLIFCNGVAHSFAVRDEFRRQGVICETVTGETPSDMRANILEDFKSGKIKCVTNNGVWTTGLDVPQVDVIGMMRHTLSPGLLIQIAGRGSRSVIDLSPYKNKEERKEAIKNSSKPFCLFLDYARMIQTHGFLDEIKGKDKGKKDGIAPMKACPECATICPAAAKHCPDCGCVFPMEEKKLVDKEAYKGELFSGAQLKKVKSVSYYPHNLNREGKTPCLMVVYGHDDGSSTREYICLQHEGFAKQKAMAWWKARGGQDVEAFGIQLIVDSGICDRLLIPESIMVKKEGKYDRITNYIKLSKPVKTVHVQELNTLADMEDINF